MAMVRKYSAEKRVAYARGACAADAAMPTGPMNSSPSDINKMVTANTTNGVEFSPPPTNGNSTNIPEPATMMPTAINRRRERAHRAMPTANGRDNPKMNRGLSDCVHAAGISNPPTMRFTR